MSASQRRTDSRGGGEGKNAWGDSDTRRIEFYRWDGTPIGFVPFTRAIDAVAISADGHTTFVAVHEPSPQIVVFTLRY